jgi:hypothetical protein
MSLDRATLDVLASMAQEIAALRARVSDLEGQESYPLTTRGDLLTRSATRHSRLAIGTTGKFLKTDGTDPSWQALAFTDLTNFVDVTSWTPTYYGLATAGVTTYTSQVGRYVRVGPFVVVWGFVVWTAATGTGQAALSLPFTIATIRTAVFLRVNGITWGGTGVQGIGVNTTNYISLESPNSNAAPTAINVEAAGDVNFFLAYLV